MPRVIWKGAISFGLVHIPVALYPAVQETGISFDWLDKRSMDPVGYRRINKRTGEEIEKDNIAKGLKLDSGDYVVLSEEEIKAAYPKSTQTIEIESFVKAGAIPIAHLDKPYFLAPLNRGEKVYALLREAMRDAGVHGVARVVMHSKEHLATVTADGDALLLHTLRWPQEVRSSDELKLPPAGKSGVGLKAGELKMAAELVQSMVAEWKPDQYAERFGQAIHALAETRVKAGDTARKTPLEEDPQAASGSNVVDLTELLRRSLGGPSRKPPVRSAPAKKPAARKSRVGSKSPARKAAQKAA
jgi:DNA end-binding protein Ku